MIVGTVSEIWRYPFKSMGGERLARCAVGVSGIPGDRVWAVRDERAGEIRGAKKIPRLLLCRARFIEEPRDGVVPPVEIFTPDGSSFLSDAADAAAALSRFLGRPVTLWPLQPATDLEHYRRGVPDHEDLESEVREILGRLPDEPIPDLRLFPPELLPFASPPGAYFDVFPLHLLSATSLRRLAARCPGATVDVRRFRPSFLIEATQGGELPELEWSGRALRVGSVEIKVETPTVRCVMPTLAQQELAADPALLRTIVRDFDQNLGVYATVQVPGQVRVGDPVALL